MITFNDNEEKKELKGPFFKKGEYDGVRVKMDNGYEGTLSHTEVDITGRGKLTFTNGDEYEGLFENGAYEGQGKYTTQNGAYTYEGAFENGKYEGQGTFTKNNGDYEIEGIFADNFCVEGVKTFRNGTVFNGTFRGQNKYYTGKLTF